MNKQTEQSSNEIIKPSTALLEQIADALIKDGFCVIENALPDVLGEKLFAYYQATESEAFHEASTGRGTTLKQDKKVRSDKIHWIDEGTQAGQHWFAWTDQLMSYLNQRLFLGLFSFESHFAHYGIGDFYQKHLDAFKGNTNRTLSLVTYLNAGWQDEDGGELIIYHPETEKPLTKVLPQFRTLVIFLSEEFPHEVLPAKKERVSIAGWFRVNSH